MIGDQSWKAGVLSSLLVILPACRPAVQSWAAPARRCASHLIKIGSGFIMLGVVMCQHGNFFIKASQTGLAPAGWIKAKQKLKFIPFIKTVWTEPDESN